MLMEALLFTKSLANNTVFIIFNKTVLNGDFIKYVPIRICIVLLR